MALLFTEGFELYSNSQTVQDAVNRGWSSVTLMGLNTTARTGNVSGHLDAYYNLGGGASATVVVGLAYTRSNTSGVDMVRFLSDAGATEHIVLRHDAAGLLHVDRGATTIASTTAVHVLPSSGTAWHYYEIKVVLNDTTGSVEVKKNGTVLTELNFSGDTKNAGTETNISRVHFPSGNNAYRHDDIYIANAAYIGEVRCHPLSPTGNGNYAQGVGSDGNSVDNYLLVDETPWQSSSADYVGIATNGQKDTYTYADLVGTGAIVSVTAASWAAKSDADPKSLRNITRIGGTDYNGADKTLATTPTYSAQCETWLVSPATATAWTAAEVNGAEFGFEARA